MTGKEQQSQGQFIGVSVADGPMPHSTSLPYTSRRYHGYPDTVIPAQAGIQEIASRAFRLPGSRPSEHEFTGMNGMSRRLLE